ncbi:uncharacterized protein LOC133332129 [Musca vetustissima]|uniref:uncharacterized protein LOC133332129 n=1 Tax=Musca vetustissima TaxID=27455 RepID=UPI002AB6EA9A|nr:uncharacterized protein LOC133332129 [Musca vetustissima]
MTTLINTIAEFWNISSVYVIYNSRISENNFIQDVLKELHRRHTYLHGLPQMLLREVDIEKPFYEIADINSSTLVLTLMNSVYDHVVEATAYAIRKYRSGFTIYLLLTYTYTEDHIYLFEQLWRYQLRRPLAIVNGKDLLTMQPYPELEFVNVTGYPMRNWFPIVEGVKDFKGYILHMPVQTDIPATYFYLDSRTRKFAADGLAAWIVRELMSRLNVTLEVRPLSIDNSYIFNYRRIFELLRSGEIELSPHLVPTIGLDPDIDFTYPYKTTSRCIMRPRPQTSNIVFVTREKELMKICGESVTTCRSN